MSEITINIPFTGNYFTIGDYLRHDDRNKLLVIKDMRMRGSYIQLVVRDATRWERFKNWFKKLFK